MLSFSLKRSCQLISHEKKNIIQAASVNYVITNNYAKMATKRRPKQKTIEIIMDKNFLAREVVDPVWLMKEYKPQKYDIKEALKFHIEMAQTDLLNNPDGYVSVKLDLDMSTKKKAKFMESFKGAVYYPNTFKEGIQKEVIAICKTEEEIEAAKAAGALHAGHTEVLKMFEKGEIADQTYDYLVCTPDTFADVVLIKKKIHKDKLPNIKTNTVSEDISEMVKRFYLSKDYTTEKISESRGVLKTKIGTLDQGVDKLAENFTSLIDRIKQHKKYQTESFITNCIVIAAPSTEKFSVDLSQLNKQLDDNETNETVNVKN